jgi:xylulokinase
MAELGVVPARAVAVGGGTKGGLWTQIVSDVTGLPQQVPAVTIGAAYGDAMLGAAATGTAANPFSWNPVAGTVLPDPSARPAYDAAYACYRELGRVIEPVSHALAAGQQQPAPWISR